MTDEPLAEPTEEGDDQAVAEGTEVTVPVEDDLEDAPADDPDAPDEPEEEGDAA